MTHATKRKYRCGDGARRDSRKTGEGAGREPPPHRAWRTREVGCTKDVLVFTPRWKNKTSSHRTHRSHFCDKLFTSIHHDTARLVTKTRTSLHATVPSRARLCVGPIIYMQTPRAPNETRFRRSFHKPSHTKCRGTQEKVGCKPHNRILSLLPYPPRTSSPLHG